MRRRIVLFAGTFLVIGAVLLAVVLMTGQTGRQGCRSRQAVRRSPPPPVPTTGPDIPGGWEMDIQVRSAGRLTQRFRAWKWTKRDDGSFLLQKPNIVMYLDDGQRVYIRSDYAEVFADEVAGGWTVRSGSLYGDVKVFLDRNTERKIPDALPDQPFDILEADPTAAPDGSQPGVVRVYTDDLQFDNNALTIRTTSRVSLFMDEAELYGRGLSIRWNENPRELRELRITHGQYMAVYYTPKDSGLFESPGAAPATQPASAPVEVATATQASTQPATAAVTQAAAEQSEVADKDPERIPDTQPDTTTASAPASEPAEPWASTMPTQPASRPASVADNIFIAEFFGTHQPVHVDAGNRRLSGAQRLALTFEWGGKFRRPQQAPARKSGQPVANPPAGGQAATAPSQPSSGPASNADKFETVIITWSGPLIVRPIGYTPEPSRQKFTFVAEGNTLEMTDPKTTVTCNKIVYQLPQQRGWLIGADADVTMSMDSGQQLTCRWMEFQRERGLAFLQGPGSMLRRRTVEPKATSKPASQPASSVAASHAAAERSEAADPKQNEAAVPERTAPTELEDRITWTGKVEVAFGENEITDTQGVTRTRQFIRHAIFNDNVTLVQGGKGDFVRCDRLRVDIDAGPDGRAFPSRADADGNVIAQTGTSHVSANHATVLFGPGKKSDTADPNDLSVEPRHVTATGEVRISDQRGDRKIIANADRLSADVLERTAILYGTPKRYAIISQDKNYLAGDEIRLDEARESAVVIGRGELRFLSNRDLGGTKLTDPRTLRILWDDGMDYSGKANQAVFKGNVALSSDSQGVAHALKCQTMTVDFEPVGPPQATAQRSEAAGKEARGATTDENSTRRLSVSADQFSKRRLTRVTAVKGVEIDSRRVEEKRLVQRMKLTTETLVYDAVASRINIPAPGTMLAEDRHVDAQKPSGAIQRPWQSLMEWNTSMEYQQTTRRAHLVGDVRMVYRSGKEVVFADRLQIPGIDKVTDGRLSTLVCQDLTVAFAEPAKPAADEKSKPGDEVLGETPRIGPLEFFRAVDKVDLRDGTWGMQGTRLVFDKAKGEAVLWGAPAKAWDGPRQWNSQTIKVEFDDKGEIRKVNTEDVNVGGG